IYLDDSVCVFFVLFLYCFFFFLGALPPPRSTLFPYTTLFRSAFTLGWLLFARPNTLSRLAGQWQVHLGAAVVGSGLGHLAVSQRSEEHTSELQSRFDLVCRLLLEKKKNETKNYTKINH